MVTLVLTNCPVGLRGHLTRWLEEVAPGVFVGKVNSRLRDQLWKIVLRMVANGRAIMIYPDPTKEQGYTYLVHRHNWDVVDIEGLALIRRPPKRTADSETGLKPGWSRESGKRRARRRKNIN